MEPGTKQQPQKKFVGMIKVKRRRIFCQTIRRLKKTRARITIKNICQGRPARTQNEERNGNGTGTERERNGTRTREMPVQHLRDSRLPYAFLAAGKKQMAIHNSYLLHLVIPSAFRAARTMQVVSFAFSPFRQENQLASFSNIFAFCYCHKMQLGTLDCGTRSFAFLAAGKRQMAIHNGYFWIWSFQCKWFLLRLVVSDRKPNLFPSVTYWHSATVTKCSWEMRIVGHGHLHF